MNYSLGKLVGNGADQCQYGLFLIIVFDLTHDMRYRGQQGGYFLVIGLVRLSIEIVCPLFDLVRGRDGSIQGKDIFNGRVDVVVCDGYTGNILLKTSEGVVTAVFDLMKQHIRKSLPAKIGALMMRKKVFKKMKKQVDKDEYGGAPLLGINGCSIISHGASNAKAIKNAVFQAIKYSESDINDAITKALVESTK